MSPALQFALSSAWAMEPVAHRRMMEILVRHADGVKLTEDELVAATGKAMPGRAAEMTIENGVATIPIHGVIAHRAGAVGRISSSVGTSVEHVRADLQRAVADPAVHTIVLDVDSPGGSVSGIAELGDEIRAARDSKPIVAHTDSLMASAAYWLSAQAHRVYATKSAEVGSIGILTSFYDGHRAAANAGFDPVVIKSTPRKGGVQGNGTFSDADRADIQREVDAFHELFLEAVAAGRGITMEEARSLGDGRLYGGTDAQKRGYIDGIATRSSAIQAARSLAGGRSAAAPSAPSPRVGATSARPARSDVDPDREAGVIAERDRITRIVASSSEAQHQLCQQLIADGTPVPAALDALAADARIRAMPEGEERWKAEFATNSALQAEFVDAETYCGWRRNDQRLARKWGRHRMAASSAGSSAAPTRTRAARIVATDSEEQWRAEFAASKELQAEFGRDVDIYLGWKRNEQRLAVARAPRAERARPEEPI